MPVPSTSVSSAPSRSKGVNSRPSRSAGMPWPVSVTLMRTRVSACSSQETATVPRGRLYLTALDSRFSSTCLARWRSAKT